MVQKKGAILFSIKKKYEQRKSIEFFGVKKTICQR